MLLLLLLLMLACEVSIFRDQVETVYLEVVPHSISSLPELGKQVLVECCPLVTGKVILALLHLCQLGGQGSGGLV